MGASGSFTLWALNLADRKAAAWGEIQSTIPIEASFSPDGRWVTYQSGEALSESDVYIQPFPDAGAKYMLPRDQQNHHPLWSPAGKEIFYIPRQGTTAVIGVTTAPQVAFGTAVPIPRGGRVEGPPSAHRNHDLMPDGKRFVGVLPEGSEQTPAAYATQVRVVLNWFEDLKQRVPVP